MPTRLQGPRRHQHCDRSRDRPCVDLCTAYGGGATQAQDDGSGFDLASRLMEAREHAKRVAEDGLDGVGRAFFGRGDGCEVGRLPGAARRRVHR